MSYPDAPEPHLLKQETKRKEKDLEAGHKMGKEEEWDA